MIAPNASAGRGRSAATAAVPWQPASTWPLVGSAEDGQVGRQPFRVLGLDPGQPVAFVLDLLAVVEHEGQVARRLRSAWPPGAAASRRRTSCRWCRSRAGCRRPAGTGRCRRSARCRCARPASPWSAGRGRCGPAPTLPSRSTSQRRLRAAGRPRWRRRSAPRSRTPTGCRRARRSASAGSDLRSSVGTVADSEARTRSHSTVGCRAQVGEDQPRHRSAWWWCLVAAVAAGVLLWRPGFLPARNARCPATRPTRPPRRRSNSTVGATAARVDDQRRRAVAGASRSGAGSSRWPPPTRSRACATGRTATGTRSACSSNDRRRAGARSEQIMRSGLRVRQVLRRAAGGRRTGRTCR